MQRVSNRLCGLVVCGASLLAAGGMANGEVLYQTGFAASEGFVPGRLRGQNNWGTLDPSDPFDVVASLPGTGSQGVQIKGSDMNRIEDDLYFAGAGYVPGTFSFAAYPVIEFSVDMRLDGPDTGDFFSEQNYFNWGSVTNGSDSATANYIGALAYDSSGDVFTSGGRDGELYADIVSPDTLGTWNRFTVRVDSTTRRTQFFLNGVSQGVYDFVFDNNSPGVFSTLNAYATPGLNRAAYTAYFDNYTVSSVPEPAAIGLLGVATLGLLRRRRQA